MKTGEWRSANGKIILFGEHAVVYGATAIAVGIPNAVKAAVIAPADEFRLNIPKWDLDVTLESDTGQFDLIINALEVKDHPFLIEVDPDIPLASGLGASAAASVAMIRAIDAAFDLGLDNAAVNDLAFECEKISHGTPSGLDNTMATYGGLMAFSRKDGKVTMEPIMDVHPFSLLVAQSGKKGYTAETVARVRAARDEKPEIYDVMFSEINALSRSSIPLLQSAKWNALGQSMEQNQMILAGIGVSCPEIDNIIDIAKGEGALGAKLTGSGDGGAVIILCPLNQNAVSCALKANDIEVKEVIVG